MCEPNETEPITSGPVANAVDALAAGVETPQPTLFRSVVAIASIVVIVAGMRVAAGLLAPLFLGVFLAMSISPMLDWLRHKGMSGRVSGILIILVFLAVGLVVIAVLLSAVNDFRARIPAYQEILATRGLALQTSIESRGINLPELGQMFQADSKAIAAAAGSLADALLSSAYSGLNAGFVAVLLLLQGSALRRWLWMTPGKDNVLQTRFAEFSHGVHENVAGLTLNNLITAFIFTGWLFLFKVDFAVMWGLLSFFLGYVPNVGMLLAAFPPIVMAFIQYGAETAIIVALGLFVIIQIINLAFNVVMGQAVDLSPAASFISFLFWAWVLGPLGALLAFPLTLAVKLILESDESTRRIAALMSSRPTKPQDNRHE